MKKLISLAVVVAFFVAIPQCLGQDADQSPAQLLTEQQLVQMFHLVMMAKEKEIECSDGIDNDEDGKIDCGEVEGFRADPDCKCGGGGGGGQAKVEICHTNSPANPPAFTGTIRLVTEKALAKHLAHGDCERPFDDSAGEFQCTCP